MAITIKKSTLTLKKTEEPAAAPVPHLTSGPVLSAGEKAPAWTFFAIAGLIGTLCVVGLLVLQYVEHDFYQDAFPLRTPQAAAPAAKPAEPKSAPAAAPAEKVTADAAKPAEAKAEPAAAAPAEKPGSNATEAASAAAEAKP